MNLRWSHTVLRVRDLDGMTAFYCDMLGFQLADRGAIKGPDGEIELVFLSGSSSDHHQLALTAARTSGDGTSLDHNAFRVGSLADVREMLERASADDRVKAVMPLTHGNAISVYFNDPEGNGIEIFCDTPWHVPQPQVMGWDPAKSNDEVLAFVEQGFRDAPGFMPMEQYRAERAKAFGEA